MKSHVEMLVDRIRAKMKNCVDKMYDNSLSGEEEKENVENYTLWCDCCVTLESLIAFANGDKVKK